MRIEEYIAYRLRDAGVRRVFGIPGGSSLPYIEAFRGAGIEFVLTSHEAAAAVMADVTGRLTGVPGVCLATYGPGAVNLASGVGGALLDRSPLLALTAEMPDEWLGRTAQMNIDHQALFRPLTKATFRASADDAACIIEESLSIAGDEYPGPVHIGLPTDLAGSPAAGGSPSGYHGDRQGRHGRQERHGRGGEAVAEREALAGILAGARRPLLAAGLTAMRHDVRESLTRFAEQHNVPVVVTPMARSVIAHDHPCFAGVLFHALSDRLRRVISAADLVIGLGYDPVEYNYESWLPEVTLLHLDTRLSDLAISGSVQYLSSPEGWFSCLEELTGSPAMVQLAAEARREIRGEIERADNQHRQSLSPVTVLAMLREALPEDAVVTADVGSHLHLLGQMWDPQRGRLIMTNGWSSMGFGLPAAVAAALAEEGATVACVTGDGGVMMQLGELMTIRRLGKKIIVVVLTDGELNLIRVKQSWKNISPYGVTLCRGPLFGSDRVLGIEVVRCVDRESLRDAIKKATRSDESLIIEAVIDPSGYDDLIVRA